VLNADDPIVAWLGQRHRGPVIYFGVDDPTVGGRVPQAISDATRCPRCRAALQYERVVLAHEGDWSCPSCGLTRPERVVSATRVALTAVSSEIEIRPAVASAFDPVRVPIAGLYNAYNALAALAAALRLEIPLERAVAGLEEAKAAFGRVETVPVAGKPVSILLIKNPAGANEVLRTLRLESGADGADVDVWIGLNDRIADGRDVSWVWDADFELLAGGVRRVVCAGTRAPEMALRLKYAGVDPSKLVIEERIAASLDNAVAAAPHRLFALPTYTALLELRTLLADRGLAKEYWR
jgi:UDP-N-acetylmuramyl tripeptide synthase